MVTNNYTIEGDTYNTLADLILLVNSINTKHVIAEVQCLKSTLLAEKHNKSTACPVKTFTKQLPEITKQSACTTES